MKKTSVAVTAFIAGLSLAFVVPNPAAKTSCQSDKPCSCAKKCPYNHKNHKCNATSKAKAQPDIKK